LIFAGKLPITTGGWGQPSAKVWRSLKLSLGNGTRRFCPEQFSVVHYRHVFCLAKGNEWFEKRCKVNLATIVSSALYHLIRLEPRSRRIQPTHPTLPTLSHSALLIGFHPSFTRQETDCKTEMSFAYKAVDQALWSAAIWN